MKLFLGNAMKFLFSIPYPVVGLLVFLVIPHCVQELSFREECYNRNRCSEIEGECFLRNRVFYQSFTGSERISTEDGAILFLTCEGLEDTCKKNCESGTLF